MNRREHGSDFLGHVVRGGRRRLIRRARIPEQVQQWEDLTIDELQQQQAEREIPQQGEAYWEFLLRTDPEAFAQLPKRARIFPPQRERTDNHVRDRILQANANRRMNRYFGTLFFGTNSPRRPRRTKA